MTRLTFGPGFDTDASGIEGQASIDVDIRGWPKIPATVLSDSIVQSIGPIFFFCTTVKKLEYH